ARPRPAPPPARRRPDWAAPRARRRRRCPGRSGRRPGGGPAGSGSVPWPDYAAPAGGLHRSPRPRIIPALVFPQRVVKSRRPLPWQPARQGTHSRTAMKTFSAKNETVQRDWYVVDAEGKTLGRLASELARRLRGKHKPVFTPHVDTGDYLIVINAEKVAVT